VSAQLCEHLYVLQQVGVMSVAELQIASALRAKTIVAPISDSEYSAAPTFLTMQVTQEELNTAVTNVNNHALAHRAASDWLMSQDDIMSVIDPPSSTGGARRAKTILLSLIHLKRLQMNGNESRTYQILRTEF
jgi:hypothetical protein